jgi:hypothetical protein
MEAKEEKKLELTLPLKKASPGDLEEEVVYTASIRGMQEVEEVE